MHVLPSIVERTARGEYSVDPYTRLLKDRIVFVGTAIDDSIANDVMAQLLYLDYDRPEREISMYLNSPGGSITAVMALYDTMRSLSSQVHTVCLGQAVSGAALLLAAGTSGKRMAQPNARMIIRQPAMEASQGQTSDLEIQATEMIRMRGAMEEILAEHTGQSRERVRADLDRDTILTAADAMAYGLIDAILPVRHKKEAA